MIIPPFAGVVLVEYRDQIELTPIYWVREFVGLGKSKAKEVRPENLSPFAQAVFDAMGDEVWVIARWLRYEDGTEEGMNINYLDSQATEAEARKSFDSMVHFQEMSKEHLLGLAACLQDNEEELAYIESRFPDFKVGPPEKGSVDERDLYQARLKVLAGMQPKTVALVERADATADPVEKAKIEREAVGAFFADLAHYWTEDLAKEWQKTNPVGSEWMCHFADVFREPERGIDPINYELALNWLRRKYNLMTAEELSDAILVATGQRVMPGTLKKRRERLGLTTKRLPGPRPNSEQ